MAIESQRDRPPALDRRDTIKGLELKAKLQQDLGFGPTGG